MPYTPDRLLLARTRCAMLPCPSSSSPSSPFLLTRGEGVLIPRLLPPPLCPGLVSPPGDAVMTCAGSAAPSLILGLPLPLAGLACIAPVRGVPSLLLGLPLPLAGLACISPVRGAAFDPLLLRRLRGLPSLSRGVDCFAGSACVPSSCARMSSVSPVESNVRCNCLNRLSARGVRL